jgi:hypothetical protein
MSVTHIRQDHRVYGMGQNTSAARDDLLQKLSGVAIIRIISVNILSKEQTLDNLIKEN